MEEPQYNGIAEQAGVHHVMNESNESANKLRQQQYAIEEAEKTLAESQLDCEITLNKLYHLLRQDVLRLNEENVLEWQNIDDEKKRVLTDEGVDKFMQIMQSYINKETLLSNFDDKQIARRMLEFSLAVSANFFMKYEVYFRVPSLEECQTILESRLDNKLKHAKIACKIVGKVYNEESVRKEILKDYEGRIDYELQKIKSEQVKINLREFEILFVQLKSIVEATHNRAWKGEERGSLRRHTSISEVIGGKAAQEKKGGWFEWAKG